MLIFLLSTFISTSMAMTMCEYYEKIGIYRPECASKLLIQNDDPVLLPQVSESLPIQRYSSLPLCRAYFHSCMSSSMCESGTVCSNGSSAGSCCTDPFKTRCPSVTAMNINCRKTRGVNWCNSDVDCTGRSTMPSVCCPTGCNYNMCIHVGFGNNQGNHIMNNQLVFSSLSAEDSCPDPYLLNMQCRAAKTTSWCTTDSECPRGGLYKRKCCPTSCGYNTCMMKFQGKWIIA